MATGFKTTDINLPAQVSSEILQKVQEASAVMRLARRTTLPGTGISVPIITGDPEAEWVTETGEKKVSKGSAELRMMTPYKLAVIQPFSMEFRRNAPALYDALVARMPGVLAQKFDGTVFGAYNKPGDNFDQFKNCTAQSLSGTGTTAAYDALVAADTDIATHGGITNGFVLSPQGKGLLLSVKDTTGRPIFINSVAEGAIPMILGSPTYQSKGAYIAGTPSTVPNTVGVVGDWTQASYGTVEGVRASISDQATIVVGSETINLWQRNMFAVLMEIEVGFRADTTVFNRLTAAA